MTKNVVRIGQHFGGNDEFVGEEAEMAKRSIDTIVRALDDHIDYDACLRIRQTGPASMGVLAFDVCGLPDGHDGLHQAGWTGTGEWFQ